MIGELIARRRKYLGLSQTELGSRTNTSQRQVSRLENGEDGVIPRRDTLERFGAVLGITLAEFYQAAGLMAPPTAPPTGDVFDRAPLARLVSAVEALPGMANQLDQLDALSPGKQEEMIRRLARRFAFEIAEELLAAESDKLAHSEK